jgi:hypothetical protein
MADNDKKPFTHLVPAILTGSAALIAALTTVYVNVRGDRKPEPAARVAAATAKPAPSGPVELHLQVDRIAVEHDGSPGTTDWRFTVEVDGEPLFAFQQDALDDVGGRNVAMPDDAAGMLRLASGKRAKIVIKGWRGSWFKFGAEPDATGEGWLSPTGMPGAIRVAAVQPEDGAFVFHFSAASEAP